MDKEESEYISRKRSTKISTPELIKSMAFLILVFFCFTTLHGYESERYDQWIIEDGEIYSIDEGKCFTCRNCGTYQWKAKCMADWRGDYYCTKCKKKL